MAHYTFRRSALTTVENWALTPDGLNYSNDGLTYFTYPFQNITSVRLKYQPTRMKTNNYSCELEFDTAPIIKIASISYISFAKFEDKAVDYCHFVKELTSSIVKVNPHCKFYSGRKLSALMIESILVLLMLTFLFWIFMALDNVVSGVIIFKLLIILYSLFYLIKSFTINKPGFFDPNIIPNKILPIPNN